MKPREQRLQAILELLVAGPDRGVARDVIFGRVMAAHHVGLHQVREDLKELEIRAWIEWRGGFPRITAVGRRKLLELQRGKEQRTIVEAAGASS